MIITFGQAEGYKINTQMLVALLCTNDNVVKMISRNNFYNSLKIWNVKYLEGNSNQASERPLWQDNLHIQYNFHKNSNILLYRAWKTVLNFIWKSKNPSIAKTILYSKRTSGCITMLELQLCYRAIKLHGIVIKTDWSK